MKKIFRFILSLFLLTLAVEASAAGAPDRGKWLCNSCELAAPATAMTAADLGAAWAFIRSTVNTQTGNSWKQNELVTVCDGTACMSMSFQALACGCWMPLGPTYKDDGRGYKNAQVDKNPPPKGGKSGDSGTGSLIVRFFHGVWSFFTGTPKLLNPTVEIHQGTAEADLASYGFGPTFASGFAWDSNGSTFSYGQDFAYGSTNAEVASGTLSAGGGCGRDGCFPTMER